MEEIAPASIAVTARLGASGDHDGGGHGGVVAALARGDVGITPVHIEDLAERVCLRLTPGTVQPRQTRGIGPKLCHWSLARGSGPSAGMIARARGSGNPLASAICHHSSRVIGGDERKSDGE